MTLPNAVCGSLGTMTLKVHVQTFLWYQMLRNLKIQKKIKNYFVLRNKITPSRLFINGS